MSTTQTTTPSTAPTTPPNRPAITFKRLTSPGTGKFTITTPVAPEHELYYRRLATIYVKVGWGREDAARLAASDVARGYCKFLHTPPPKPKLIIKGKFVESLFG